MDFNYLPIASLKSEAVACSFIAVEISILISWFFSTLFTINNTVEKYYQ